LQGFRAVTLNDDKQSSCLHTVVMTFATAVLEARRTAGISQREAAKRAGITQAYISLIERGTRTPSLPAYTRLTRALNLPLGVGLDDLL
jgi:transcriptional regulator with XRE-family HTH domain